MSTLPESRGIKSQNSWPCLGTVQVPDASHSPGPRPGCAEVLVQGPWTLGTLKGNGIGPLADGPLQHTGTLHSTLLPVFLFIKLVAAEVLAHTKCI